MEVFDLQMLPFKSKPAKNLIWPENMSHIFQLVSENFLHSCTVCLGKGLSVQISLPCIYQCKKSQLLLRYSEGNSCYTWEETM